MKKKCSGSILIKNRNVLLKMKFILIFLLIGITQLNASIYSQTTKLNLNLTHASVEDVLDEYSSKGDLNFIHRSDLFNDFPEFNIEEKNITVVEFLEKYVVPKGYEYEVENKAVIIKKSALRPLEIKEVTPSKTGQQQNEIKGQVSDMNGVPIPGANVIIKGTNKGVVTDFEGNYTITDVPADAILVFSFVGMKSKEVLAAGKSVISVELEEETIGLSEVIAIGYGSQKKKDLTGSVAIVDGEELSKTSSMNVSQALQGKVSGVQISSNSGEPGGSMAVRIRGIGTVGNSDPLYVIDGFPTKSGINSINPADIESITVLKDAAACAIYGARAANGVILVTTKKGKEGEAKVTVEAYYGFQQAANKIDVLNSRDYVMITREAYRNSGYPDDEFWEDESNYGAGKKYPTDVDWIDQVLQNAPIQNYQATVSAGNAKSKYLVSAGYYSMEGILIESGFDRFSFRVNGDTKVGEKLRVGNNLSFSVSSQDWFETDHSWSGLLFSALRFLPTKPIYEADGAWGGNVGPAEYVGDGGNPVRMAKLNYDERQTYRLLGNAFVEYKLIEGLQFRSSFGYDLTFRNNKDFDPTYKEGVSQAIRNGLTRYNSTNTTWIWENTLNYEFDIDEDHSFSILAGITAEDNKLDWLSASRVVFPNNEEYIRYLDAGTGTRDNGGNSVESSLFSMIGRLNYSYKGKYLAQVNIRRDGSSRFGESNQYGTFPSTSFGWRVSEEDFFDSGKISNLKLRLSYGKLGNQDIYSNYPWAGSLSLMYYPLGESQATLPAYAPTSPSNPDIKWETTIQKNIGVDLGLFNQKLTITADYFIKDTEDMLLKLPAPGTSGFTSTAFTNAGEMRNKGFELAAQYNGKAGDLDYSIGGNISAIKNEVTGLGTLDYIWSDQTYLGERWTRTEVGRSISEFYGYVADGIFQNEAEIAEHGIQPDAKPGDIRFKNITEDDVLDDKDRTYIGSPHPDFIYSLTSSLAYKNFDFFISLQGSQGNKIYNGMLRQIESASEPYNKWSHILDRWTGEGTSNTVPRVTRDDTNNNARSSSRMVEDGSYLRIKNLQVGYTIPANLIAKSGISNLRFYVSTNNLYTFTKYRGFDPEMYKTENSGTDIGVDRAKYPVARSFMLGVNLTF